MGVPGLWDVSHYFFLSHDTAAGTDKQLLRPSATRTSLSTLAREAFYNNKNGLRALTIGIDAS